MIQEPKSRVDIKTKAQQKRLKTFLMELWEFQDKNSDSDTLIKPTVAIGLAVKYDIIIRSFLMHPLVLSAYKYYDEFELIVDKAGLAKKISEVLEYEMTCDLHKTTISDRDRDKLIKVFNRLNRKRK